MYDLWCHAQAKGVMVTVVGCVLCQLKTSQMRMGIPEVDMVDPSSCSVSRPSHKLLEAEVIESSREERVGMLV